MSEIKFSNESGGSMIDPFSGDRITWLSKNRVRLTEESTDAVELANILVELVGEIKEWAERLDKVEDHPDLQGFFRLSVTIGQPRPEQEKVTPRGSMANMDLDDENDDDNDGEGADDGADDK